MERVPWEIGGGGEGQVEEGEGGRENRPLSRWKWEVKGRFMALAGDPKQPPHSIHG